MQNETKSENLATLLERAIQAMIDEAAAAFSAAHKTTEGAR